MKKIKKIMLQIENQFFFIFLNYFNFLIINWFLLV
jgi:hypothetical protein